MDQDHFSGAACAASDLSARLTAEVQRALRDLQAAEQNYQDAAFRALRAGQPAPTDERRVLLHCRRDVDVLERILAGVTDHGGYHAKSA